MSPPLFEGEWYDAGCTSACRWEHVRRWPVCAFAPRPLEVRHHSEVKEMGDGILSVVVTREEVFA